MKLFAIAYVFALCSILVTGSAIHLHRRGSPSICGEGSEVLNQTSVAHAGKTILVSTSTCPPTKRDTIVSKRSSINIDKGRTYAPTAHVLGNSTIGPTAPARSQLRIMIQSRTQPAKRQPHTTLLSRVTPSSERRRHAFALVAAGLVIIMGSQLVDHEYSCLPEHRNALLQKWIGVGIAFLDPSTG
ncbi:hypothetical protein BC826DRAFT_971844 [Russula brevipes]|nr:hypothetical protein BC826DRAFT_971844 [Russula brevipes]